MESTKSGKTTKPEIKHSNYWYVIIVAALIIIGLVILIMLLTKESSIPEKEKEVVCKSAEYPTIAENTSSTPNIVEVSLTASDNEVQILDGDATKMYNYNKSFPGPMIDAKRGDTLIVHFFNDISEPSTITFHGLLTPANMDGSQISQPPVNPGESFTYQFYLGESGLFYYHSDINPRDQVSKGLFGAILVHDYEEDQCFSLPREEKVLAFSDLKLNSQNQVDIGFSGTSCQIFEEKNNGIVGNVLLTNGVENGCIKLVRDEPVRLRMVNCATDRFMKIFIEGHDMLKVGGDQGLLERPVLIKNGNGIMLTTGERADVVFVPRHENIRLVTEANPRGTQKVETDECGNCQLTDVTVDRNKKLLVTFNTVETGNKESLKVPLSLRCVKRIKVDHCTPVIPVNFGVRNVASNEQDPDPFYAYRVDGCGVPFDCLSPKQAPVVFEDGVYIIEIANYSDLANNFFLHGFTFQHLDTLYLTEQCKDREINKVLENKDTIYIPPRPDRGRKSKTVVRLAVDFSNCGRDIIAYGKHPTECRSGGWIFQSHILSHSEYGQQGFIQIVAECDRSKYSSDSGYLNSYSKYSSGDYSTCLTKSSDTCDTRMDSKTDTRSRMSSSICDDSNSLFSKCRQSLGSISLDSFDSYDSVNSIRTMTHSFITCSCGSGLSTHKCSCSSKSFRSSLESRLSSKYSSDSSSDECNVECDTTKSIEYSPYSPPSHQSYSNNYSNQSSSRNNSNNCSNNSNNYSNNSNNYSNNSNNYSNNSNSYKSSSNTYSDSYSNSYSKSYSDESSY